jgi:ribosomal protein S18 acetylase RimI-like enzyme
MRTSDVDYDLRRVSCMDILDAPNAQELFAQYAEDCMRPGSQPQVEIYQKMQNAGMLACFGAYAGETLVGFATVVASVMPHDGKRIASLESLFVKRAFRDDGVATMLLSQVRHHAIVDGCAALLYTARVGSELEVMLHGVKVCERTHSVFTEWLC